jgi:hypothetical protein
VHRGQADGSEHLRQTDSALPFRAWLRPIASVGTLNVLDCLLCGHATKAGGGHHGR